MSLYPNAGEEKKKEHRILLSGREEMSVVGVLEVMGFDEECVRLESSEGELCIEGEGIKIETLDTDGGSLTLKGRISAVYYISEGGKRKKRGVFGRGGR